MGEQRSEAERAGVGVDDREIDCRRLLCPMPVIRVQDEVARMSAGERLAAVCSDPGVLHDIPAWCRIHGHEVAEVVEAEGEYVVVVRVGATVD